MTFKHKDDIYDVGFFNWHTSKFAVEELMKEAK